ncbi:MAG: two-component regulator propeller domain-containing protein [Bacteroidota bacterium]|nr:two-component regulator propeller domain-containing protein [Bacteroidota bacterium]
MKIRIFAILILLVCGMTLPGQNPYFRTILPAYFPAGLRINKIYQSSDGFIWLGTTEGLYRYNGFDFERIGLAEKQDPGNITAICESTDSTLWLGFESGLIATCRHNEIKLFNKDTLMPESPVVDIIQDARGRMWLGTYGEGILLVEGQTVWWLDTGNGLNDNYVYDLENGPAGSLWAGTDAGIAICRFRDNQFETSAITTREGLPDIIVTQLCRDVKGDMLIGMQDAGVARWDVQKDRLSGELLLEVWPYGRVSGILPFKNSLWISTSGSGIIDLHPSTGGVKTYTEDQEGFVFNRIEDILAGVEGNYWIASGNHLIQSSGEKFEFIVSHEDLDFSDPLALLADDQGLLWFSNSQGLFSHPLAFTGNQKLKKYQTVSDKLNIMSIYRDPGGFVWLGTFGKGLYRLNPDTGEIMHFTEKDGLINDNVLSIDGSYKEIWLATLGGVSRLMLPGNGKKDKSAFRFQSYREENGLGNNFIYAVFVDAQGRVWFGTDGNGITLYTGKTFINYDEDDGLKDNVVYSITEDRTGNIWFTTSESGIYRFDGLKFISYGLEDGIRDLSISGIETDEAGNIIILHDKGLDIFNPEDGNIRYYGEEVGLLDVNPNLNAITRDRNGNIWFGATNGIVKYQASAYKYLDHPITRITGVSVYLQPVDVERDHIFSWDQNHFSFSYIGLWYIEPDVVNYEIMLEGHDLEWNRSKNRFITYSQLSPGKYTFKVRSGIGEDFSHAEMMSYSFEIRPPFWNTWWFYLLLAILLGSIVFAYIKYREIRLRVREKLKKEKLEFEFQTLKNQVNPHFLFNSFSTLISLIENNDKLAVEYVEKLSEFFRNILQYRDMELISLKEETGIIQTYFFIQQKRYGQNLRYEIDIPEVYLESLIPPLTLQMLIENAIKHNVVSRSKPLQISVEIKENYIRISNKRQPKAEAERSTGVGLNNIRERYRIIAGREIKIEQDDETFCVLLPLIKKYKV